MTITIIDVNTKELFKTHKNIIDKYSEHNIFLSDLIDTTNCTTVEGVLITDICTLLKYVVLGGNTKLFIIQKDDKAIGAILGYAQIDSIKLMLFELDNEYLILRDVIIQQLSKLLTTHLFKDKKENIMPEPTAYTSKEVKEMFINHVRNLVQSWTNIPNCTIADRCNGIAFSILTCLDGCAELPSFTVIPTPHPSDKQYHIDNNEHYFTPIENLSAEEVIKQNISGTLHDRFCHI